MRSYVSPANSVLVPDYPTSAICQSQAIDDDDDDDDNENDDNNNDDLL